MIVVKSNQYHPEQPPSVKMKPQGDTYINYCACCCFSIDIVSARAMGGGTLVYSDDLFYTSGGYYPPWERPYLYGLPNDTKIPEDAFSGFVNNYTYFSDSDYKSSSTYSSCTCAFDNTEREATETMVPRTFNYLTYLTRNKCEGSRTETSLCGGDYYTNTETLHCSAFSRFDSSLATSNTTAVYNFSESSDDEECRSSFYGSSRQTISNRIQPKIVEEWALANFEANNLSLDADDEFTWGFSGLFSLRSKWQIWPIDMYWPPDNNIKQIINSVADGAKFYKFRYTPSPTGYLKVWVRVYTGSTRFPINNAPPIDTDYEKLISYEFNTPVANKNNSCWEDHIESPKYRVLDFLEDFPDGSLYDQRLYRDGVTVVQFFLDKYSFDPNYEPNNTDWRIPQPNGFPDPNWKPIPK